MNTLMPAKPGQICKIISPIADMEPEEVYIITQDPADFQADEEILVVSLKELQRNVTQPDHAKRLGVRKDGLVVVGDDLASYVQSWNTPTL